MITDVLTIDDLIKELQALPEDQRKQMVCIFVNGDLEPLSSPPVAVHQVVEYQGQIIPLWRAVAHLARLPHFNVAVIT